MKAKYMIILSFDAVSSEDIDILKELPNFKKLIENGSYIRDVRSVYPSLTYPAHTTIVTGKKPCNHGIVGNRKFKAGDFNSNWYWFRKDVKGDTIYDLAKKKGMKTCGIFWPVAGGSSLDYNIAEIFPVKPYQHQIIQSMRGGSIFYQLDLNKRFGKLREGLSEPALDNFVLECTKYTIEKYTPELMLVHLIDVDSNRHDYGYNSKEANEALLRQDNRLGEIITSLKNAGIYEDTDIIALGDHSQKNIHTKVKLNKLFLEKNLISFNANGKLREYKAISKSLDGSAYVYLKSNSVLEEVKGLLKNTEGVDFILEGKEIIEAGGDPKASFMVEALEGYYFVDSIIGDVIEETNDNKNSIEHKVYKATHGYHPDKDNYGTFFIGYGKDFKKGVVIEKGDILNHGPTIAKVLGVDLKNVDGKVIDDILE